MSFAMIFVVAFSFIFCKTIHLQKCMAQKKKNVYDKCQIATCFSIFKLLLKLESFYSREKLL